MAKQEVYNEEQNEPINIISEGTIIKGDIIANGDIRIDGELIGNITAKGRLVVGPTGKIRGPIDSNNIEVLGTIKGKITASELLKMKSTSQIEGDIIAGKLSVEPGAVFFGTCTIGGTTPVKETVKETEKEKETGK